MKSDLRAALIGIFMFLLLFIPLSFIVKCIGNNLWSQENPSRVCNCTCHVGH